MMILSSLGNLYISDSLGSIFRVLFCSFYGGHFLFSLLFYNFMLEYATAGSPSPYDFIWGKIFLKHPN